VESAALLPTVGIWFRCVNLRCTYPGSVLLQSDENRVVKRNLHKHFHDLAAAGQGRKVLEMIRELDQDSPDDDSPDDGSPDDDQDSPDQMVSFHAPTRDQMSQGSVMDESLAPALPAPAPAPGDADDDEPLTQEFTVKKEEDSGGSGGSGEDAASGGLRGRLRRLREAREAREDPGGGVPGAAGMLHGALCTGCGKNLALADDMGGRDPRLCRPCGTVPSSASPLGDSRDSQELRSRILGGLSQAPCWDPDSQDGVTDHQETELK
jgi:hypothetical protein